MTRKKPTLALFKWFSADPFNFCKNQLAFKETSLKANQYLEYLFHDKKKNWKAPVSYEEQA
jgi:hypothetical protein